MAIRLFGIFLGITGLVYFMCATLAVNAAYAAEPEVQSVIKETQTETVIQPEVTRRKIDLADIDTEDFELGIYAGLLSVEDFGVNTVVGIKFSYHINEDLFVETAYAQSDTDRTSYERLSGSATLLTEDQRKLTYYNVSIGFNLLPGEAFLTRDSSYNSALYLIAGIGSTEFAGDDRLTINIGGGYRLLATDWLAIHAGVRDHLFKIDTLGEDKTAHNFEISLGVTAFF